MKRRTLLAWAAGLPFVGLIVKRDPPPLPEHIEHVYDFDDSWQSDPAHILSRLAEWWDSWPRREMNSRLLTTDGSVRMYVSASCPHLIKDLEGVVFLEGGSGEIEWVDPNDPFSIQIGHPPAIHLTAGEVREYVRELNATYPRPRSDGPFYGPGCGFHYRGIPILVSRVSDLREGAGRG